MFTISNTMNLATAAADRLAPCSCWHPHRHRLPPEGLEPRTGITVSVAKTAKACFADTITVTGLLIPKEEAFVRPEREGLQISQVLVEEGELVTAGQGLIRLTALDAPAGTAPITLTAPVAGKVRRVAATVGTLASMRADPLVQIISQGEIELLADVLSRRPRKTCCRAASESLRRRSWPDERASAPARADSRSR